MLTVYLVGCVVSFFTIVIPVKEMVFKDGKVYVPAAFACLLFIALSWVSFMAFILDLFTDINSVPNEE